MLRTPILNLVFLVVLGGIISIATWYSSGTSSGVRWSFELAKQNAQLVQVLGDPGVWKISDDVGGKCGGGGEVFDCGFNYKIHGPNGVVDIFVNWEEKPNTPTKKEVKAHLPQGTEIVIFP